METRKENGLIAIKTADTENKLWPKTREVRIHSQLVRGQNEKSGSGGEREEVWDTSPTQRERRIKVGSRDEDQDMGLLRLSLLGVSF